MDVLRKNKLFAHLTAQESNLLIDRAQRHRYESGAWIVLADEVWPMLFLILKGEVTAIKESYEGRSLVLATISTGEVFWGMAFFIAGAPMPAALRAEKACDLLVWSKETLLPFLLRDGKMAWELTQMVIGRVQLASEMVEKLAFLPVEGRLARLLLEQSGEADTPRLTRDLTLEEMAARIGTKREIVCRFLHRFAADGLIDITRTEFNLVDRKRLEALALKVKG